MQAFEFARHDKASKACSAQSFAIADAVIETLFYVWKQAPKGGYSTGACDLRAIATQ